MKKISNQKKAYYSGIVKKTIVIKSSSDKVWKKISNVVGLPEWLIDVKKTVYLSKIKKGIGVIRNITFDDGNQIEEHVVAWKNKEYFSYLALNGMPLRAYHATISIKPQTRKSTLVAWQTYLNSKKMTKSEFKEFKLFLENFYHKSLRNLKLILEK